MVCSPSPFPRARYHARISDRRPVRRLPRQRRPQPRSRHARGQGPLGPERHPPRPARCHLRAPPRRGPGSVGGRARRLPRPRPPGRRRRAGLRRAPRRLRLARGPPPPARGGDAVRRPRRHVRTHPRLGWSRTLPRYAAAIRRDRKEAMDQLDVLRASRPRLPASPTAADAARFRWLADRIECQLAAPADDTPEPEAARLARTRAHIQAPRRIGRRSSGSRARHVRTRAAASGRTPPHPRPPSRATGNSAAGSPPSPGSRAAPFPRGRPLRRDVPRLLPFPPARTAR